MWNCLKGERPLAVVVTIVFLCADDFLPGQEFNLDSGAVRNQGESLPGHALPDFNFLLFQESPEQGPACH